MVKQQSSKRDISKIQRHWSKKLKHAELNDLDEVCTFASGVHSHVSLVQLRGHPESAFALKSIRKSKITDPVERQNILAERKILREIRSDFIVKLYKTYKDNKFLHLLTEYLPGGELFNVGKLSEDSARFYMACVIEALDCLHKKNVAHNDLKTMNLVLDADGYVKLIDFGTAFQLPPGEKMQGFYYGTIEYIPPEASEGIRDKAGDLWALGCILYRLLNGGTPFDTDDEDETTWRNILKGIDDVSFPREDFSEEAEDLVRKLCKQEPASRLGYENIDAIREHCWFDGFDWYKLRNRQLTAPKKPQIDSVIDTNNFTAEVADNDSDIEEDESDWDVDF